ncbi:aminopeptidase P family protein [uncultured Clostridium sp.]|jgi:Xaa-Pro aminopeptidase|uniref:aminopeptidase P family protein n=1 Tax=uncultured Clostridium sp. TaxID=59620 RepID=UPI0026367C66|nr:aminopeptidase P family protein [uncultured Clostridium sp.]
MINTIFKNNRENLAKILEDNSILVMFASEAKYKSADERYNFTPNRNFYYLTGVDEEKDILLIKKENGEVSQTLFISEPDEVMAKWVGATFTKEEAKEKSGVENIAYLGSFLSSVNTMLGSDEIENIYLDLERRDFDEAQRESGIFADNIVKRYPQANVKNAFNIISELRLRKNEAELTEMRNAVAITKGGVELLMKSSKAGMMEYELEAYFDFYLKQHGVKDFAFKTIAASGKNAATLHYHENSSEMKDGDLILFDLGAQLNYYNSDVSRTFPVNGKFSDRQRDLYQAVLDVNIAMIDMMKPGVTMKAVNEAANDMLAQKCLELGLTEKKEDFRKYYFHSIGHSLGLDTHDVGKRLGVLEEGMVWTIEPGLYIPEENVGIRIEDDVLITATGHEVLTKGIIKSIEDIEKFMAK